MVILRKVLKIKDVVKECSIELDKNGKCALVVDNKILEKYSSLDNCLYNNSFLEVTKKEVLEI